MDVPVAANVLGVTGAICWSVQVCIQDKIGSVIRANMSSSIAHSSNSHQLSTP